MIAALMKICAVGIVGSHQPAIEQSMGDRYQNLNVFVIRWSPSSARVRAIPELARTSIFTREAHFGRRPLSEIVNARHALGGVNGDFYDKSGDPLGAMMSTGEVISRPILQRPSVGWGQAGSIIGRLRWTCTIENSRGTIQVQGLNEECPTSATTLYTEKAGLAVASTPCRYWIVRPQQATLRASGVVSCVVVAEVSNLNSIPIPPAAWVIAQRAGAHPTLRAKPGEVLGICHKLEGMDFSTIENVISGGPFLIRKGKHYIDCKETRFDSYIANKPFSRTAIGRTKNGELLFVIIEGRAKLSRGVSLKGAAQIMQSLGCIDAINLDGGGGSTLHWNGRTMNQPTDGNERNIANAVLFFAR